MKKKIEGKIKAAHMWRYILIISAVLLAVAFILKTKLDSKVTTILFGAAIFATVVSLVVYFGFRRNILKCVDALEKSGVSIDDVAIDLEEGEAIGKVRKIVCGKKYFTVPSPFCVFAYSDILWIYGKKTTTTNTSTGATTTNKTVMFCTVNGKRYATHISMKAAKKLIEEYKDKFSPDLIVGYKMKYNKMYKEMVKKNK